MRSVWGLNHYTAIGNYLSGEKNMDPWHDFTGELVGTFILVLFGCGSVAVTNAAAAFLRRR
jgi:hypothetical protein